MKSIEVMCLMMLLLFGNSLWHPVEIIRTYYTRQEEDPLLEEMWNNFKVPESAGDSIVLGTGSHK